MLPHRNKYIAGLLFFNMMLPYWTINMVNWCMGDHGLAKSSWEYIFGFIKWKDEKFDYHSFTQTRLLCELPHKYIRFVIFYLDILYIGSYWSNYFGYVPLMVFIGVVKIMRTSTMSAAHERRWEGKVQP